MSNRKITLAFGIFALIQNSCGSYSLPPVITSRAGEAARQTEFNAVVGVGEFKWIAWRKKLCRELRATGMFTRVDLEEDLDEPSDLVARVTGTVDFANPWPVLTFLSLGVIPTIAEDEHGIVFSLEPSKTDRESPIDIDFRYRGSTHIGWFATLSGLLPSRTYFHPSSSERYVDWLRLRVWQKSDSIRAAIAETRRRRR